VPTSAIGESFHKTARDKADVVAVLTMTDGSVSTFADLAGGVIAAQRGLAASGVDRGAVVIALVGNTPDFFSIVVACMEAGVALRPICQATGAEMDASFAQSGAGALITDRPIQCDVVRDEQVTNTVRILRLRDPIDRQQCGASVVLKLTSGSTSIPKAAIASELNLINDGRHIVEAMGIGPSDVNATYIPLSHSYALGNVVMPLLCQGTSAALYQSFNPRQVVQAIAEARATVSPGVPFTFDRIQSTALIVFPTACGCCHRRRAHRTRRRLVVSRSPRSQSPLLLRQPSRAASRTTTPKTLATWCTSGARCRRRRFACDPAATPATAASSSKATRLRPATCAQTMRGRRRSSSTADSSPAISGTLTRGGN
jgi:acyl-CoA synthetase (AMP-forming)/AMP-acid ligase II